VEDPHNPDNDVGCIAFKIESAKEAFFQAYNLLAESKSQHPYSPASSEDESRKSNGDFSCSQPELNVSQLMWVNYSPQCFRARIKSIYRSCDSPAIAICPIHPTTKIHSSLTLSSTRYFNNGTKPHKHKNYGPIKDNNKRLSKKSYNNRNSISFHMDDTMIHVGNKSWRGDSDSNHSNPNRSPENNFKIVGTDFPGLAKNIHGVSPYDSPPSI